MGAVLILVGMMFFTLGAEMSMTPMGERIGTCLTRSRNLPVIVAVAFLLGFIVTISEPDLQVLAGQVPAVPNMTLILSVACGVGAFLVIALLRMLFSMALPPLLVVCYAVVFVLAAFVPKDFLSVAFDSGRRYHRSHDRAVHHGPGRGRIRPSEATAMRPTTASAWWPCARWGRSWP